MFSLLGACMVHDIELGPLQRAVASESVMLW